MLTGEHPYASLSRDVHVLIAMSKKQLPDKPHNSSTWNFQKNFLWKICERCWHFDSNLRPSMATIVEEIKGVEDLLSTSHRIELLRTLAPDLTDQVEKSSHHPVASGGFSNIYLGKSLAHGGRAVAIKEIQVYIYKGNEEKLYRVRHKSQNCCVSRAE